MSSPAHSDEGTNWADIAPHLRDPKGVARQVRILFAEGKRLHEIERWLQQIGFSTYEAQAFLSEQTDAKRKGSWVRDFGLWMHKFQDEPPVFSLCLYLIAAMAFASGYMQLQFAIGLGRPSELSGPWFVLGMLAAFTGSALLAQRRELHKLKEEVAKFRKSSNESDDLPDSSDA